MFAASMKAADGGNVRVSCKRASIVADGDDPLAEAGPTGALEAAGAAGRGGAAGVAGSAAVAVAAASAGAACTSGTDGAVGPAASGEEAGAVASLARSGCEPRLNHEKSLDMPYSPFILVQMHTTCA